MTVAIRQEINIINTNFVGVDDLEVIFDPVVNIDSGNYNGWTAYLEIVGSNLNPTIVNYAHLFNAITSAGTYSSVGFSIAIPANSNRVLLRSSSFTLSIVNLFYKIAHGNDTNVSDMTIHSASIVILQSADNITNTQTQIEVGQYGILIPSAINTWYAIPEPKYWQYEAAKWDPTPKYFRFGFTMGIADDKETYIIGLQEASDAAFTSDLSYITASQITVTTEAVTYYESPTFTPKDGYYYRVVYQGDDYKDEITLYNAKVIATQTDYTGFNLMIDDYSGFIYGTGGVSEAAGQMVNIQDPIDCKYVLMRLSIEGSPTDNVYMEIASSVDGAPIANGTSNDVPYTAITGSPQWIVFEFPTPPTLDGVYYFRALRDGSRDTDNFYDLLGRNDGGSANALIKDDGIWALEGDNNDYAIKIYEAWITKLQPEYLLINEGQTDTGLQEFPINWNPDEWVGVENVYHHEHSADSSGSNTKLLDRTTLYSSPYTTTGPQIFGGTGTSEEAAGSFTTPNDGVSYIVKGVYATFQKISTPTDNHQIRLTTTLGDTPIATTNPVAASAIIQGFNIYFEFPSDQTLAPNTKYYLEIYRSGVRDSLNYLALYKRNLDSISGAGNISKSNGSWGSENDDDPSLIIYGWSDVVNSNMTGDDLTRSTLATFDEYISYDAESNIGGLKTYDAYAQSFTGKAGTLGRVEFTLRKILAPSGNVYAKLYAHSGTYGVSSLLTGSVLATSDPIVATALPISFDDGVSFNFSVPYTMIDGIYYVIVLEFTGGTDSAYINIRLDTSGSHDGNLSRRTQSTQEWSASASQDLMFKIYHGALTMPATAKEIDAFIITA